MRHRAWREDGYRVCSYCKNEVFNVCNGFVNAGDMVLFMRGQIMGNQVRERCQRCVLRHTAAREGRLGIIRLVAARIYDFGRLVSWRLQFWFRPLPWFDCLKELTTSGDSRVQNVIDLKECEPESLTSMVANRLALRLRDSSTRQIERDTGISKATLSRIARHLCPVNGRHLDVLVRYLNIDYQ